jgi:hypothetical protein
MLMKKENRFTVPTILRSGMKVLILILMFSCNRDAPDPVPGPLADNDPENPAAPVVITEYIVTTFNADGLGFVNGATFWNYSDGTDMDMPNTGIRDSPGKPAGDKSYRLKGVDNNKTYWLGGCGHNAVPSFGLPNTPNRVWLNLELYSPISTSNIEAYIIEDDGDVFKHALPSGLTPQGEWKIHSMKVSDFTLDVAQSTGNGQRDDLSTLGKVQFTLLSGGGAGNASDIYINYVIFTTGGPIDYYYP